MTRRTVVAGGAGFIGSHLCERLLGRGDEVVCVDSLITGRRGNLPEHPRLTFVEADVCDGLPVEGGFDVLYHLASPASPVMYAKVPIETLRVCSVGTIRLLEAAERAGALFVLASTSEVYGDPEVHPQVESYWGHVNPIGPRSPYDEGKRFAEAVSMAWERTGRVRVRIARIFNTYGPRMRSDDGRVVPAFLERSLAGRPLVVHGDGLQTRSLCYVDDLVEGLIALEGAPDPGPYNLGNPEEITILDLARKVIELTGSKSRIEHGPLPKDDPRRRRPDITRARERLGWRPRVTLEEGLRRTLASIRNA